MGVRAVFLLIFRTYTLCDLLKIKYQKSAYEITTAWWLGVRKTSLCGDSLETDHPFVVISGPGKIFLIIFRPLQKVICSKSNIIKVHAKSPLRGDWGSERNFFAYYLTLYIMWLAQKKNIKKCIQNHHCVVIGGPDTIFLLNFRPYTIGDLLKIKYQKSA